MEFVATPLPRLHRESATATTSVVVASVAVTVAPHHRFNTKLGARARVSHDLNLASNGFHSSSSFKHLSKFPLPHRLRLPVSIRPYAIARSTIKESQRRIGRCG